MFKIFDSNKIIMCCMHGNDENPIYDIISKYVEHKKKKLIFDKEEDNLKDKNIVISKFSDVKTYAKYDVKIFIIANYDEYMNYSKQKNFEIDIILMPHRINFGFMMTIYNDYLFSNSRNNSFTSFMNDCCHNEKNEHIVIYTKHNAYFRYNFVNCDAQLHFL